MLIESIVERVKNFAESFSKPQTYGSALEYYIISNNPQSEGDIDRLTREFQARQDSFIWARGL